jgi:glycosyltransferase involved in cell wall biosynthesis
MARFKNRLVEMAWNIAADTSNGIARISMAFHVVFNRPTDLASISERAQKGLNPRHSMAVLAEALNASVHDGSGLTPDFMDKLVGKITRTSPLWWAIARKLRREVKPGDVIYCTGEDVGVPVATLCGRLPDVRVAVMAHYIDRPKGHLALKVFQLKRSVSLFLTVAKPQADFLSRFLKSPGRVLFVPDQTDTGFFSPGPASPQKLKPVIMSVGLEQRNYITLAEATADLDVDVRISGYSADTKVLSRAFPSEMPTNMSQKFYSWPDLLQLYRDADVVVVSLYPNNYAAGIQALMEALACGRPVVVTATEGLEGYLDRPETMQLVQPGNANQMRESITQLLLHPETRREVGLKAAALARERHTLEQYIATIADALRGLATGKDANR